MLLFLVWVSPAPCRSSTIAETASKDSVGVTTSSSDTIAQAVDSIPINNMLITEPFGFIYRANAKYYRTISSNIVGGVGVDYGWFDKLVDKGSTYGFNAEVRYYPDKNSPYGFYAAPDASYTVGKALGTTVVVMTVGLLAGWQWFAGDHVCVGMVAGFDDYIRVSGPPNSFTFAPLFGASGTGLLPTLRFDIGYGW
jgi:hypothetical protein